jgi:uncharacterized membrane protein
MAFLILAVVVVLVWVVLSRLRRLEERAEEGARERARNDETIAGLVRRVWALENSHLAPAARVSEVAPAAPAPEIHEALVRTPIATPEPITLPAPIEIPAPIAISQLPAVEEEPGPSTPPPLPVLAQEAPPRETWQDRLRQNMGGQEWEAVVGGSWLNKVGVLVLVIGIALLLGYEFTRVGPAGRVAIGMAVGLTMLVGGVLLERRTGYAIFARGLIGGGWAAVYFTTFAMHGLPTAKVIDNPYLATALLLGVATAMILHSLRYRSQTVSGLAYFIAFATLALSESTPFSVLALLPLAGSLLYVAYRFDWYQMAVFGLFATYATCASRPDAGAPLASTQALFAMYWLLFETFDLLSLRRRSSGWRVESFILPLNALGFLALSLVKWHRAAPAHLYKFLAAGAALYLASALLRARIRPPSAFEEGSSALSRIASGSYEGPVTLAAALAAASIFRGATGEWINLGLLIEGEILFAAGFLFRQTYLRRLAGAVFVGAVVKVMAVDPWGSRTIPFAGRKWADPFPVALLTAAVFYLNRMFRVAEGALYTWTAAGLVTLVLGSETPEQYLGVAWLAFTALLFECGFRLHAAEFRYQSYVVGLLGTGAALLVNVVGAHKGSPASEPLSLGIATLLCYGLSGRVFRTMPERIDEAERGWCRDLYAAAGTVFALTLAWLLLPAPLVALAWAIIGLVLLELGFGASLARFRLLGNLVAASVCGRLFLANFTDLGDTLHISHRMLTVVPILISQYYVWLRYRQANVSGWERNLTRLYLYAPAVLGVALLRFELGRTLAVVGWALFGLCLYRVGLVRNNVDLRWQSFAIAGLAFWRSWNTNFYAPESLGGIKARVLTGAIVIASFYCAQLLSPRDAGDGRGLLDRHARAFYSLMASVLLAVLLFYEVSGGMLTMAWGAEALALLGAGFPLRDRLQRLSGLSLFLVCVLKLFLYDLRQLETVNRILSFIVLGAILVGVSWVYTRFRNHIQRYL